jgi:hypothetical protein
MPEVKWEEKTLPSYHLNNIQHGSNYVGVFTLDPVDTPYNGKRPISRNTSGICHKPFDELIQYVKCEAPNIQKYMWWAIPHYVNLCNGEYKAEDMNEWVEFSLSPQTSPWRMLLDQFDYTVTRNDKGLVTGLIMPIPDINTVALFHWFKGLRGVIERRCVPFLYAKKNGVTDNDILYKLYVLSSYMVPRSDKPEELQFWWGGEHQPFKLRLNDNLKEAKIICKLKNYSLLNTKYYYGSKSQGEYVFGMQGLTSNQQTCYHSFIRENFVKAKTKSVARGYFTKIIEREHYHNPPNINLDMLIENVDKLWDFLA